MENLAKEIGLCVEIGNRSNFFNKLRSLLGKNKIVGHLRGKPFEIYTTKFPNYGTFPIRIVVKMKINRPNNSGVLVIRERPILSSLYKIFFRNVYTSRHKILNERLLISAKNHGLLDELLQYEEIRDQFCEVWQQKKNGGTLATYGQELFYHEPFRLLTKNTRLRIKNAAHLLCDISDVLNLTKILN